MNWKPNKWISAVLGLVLGPIGLLYAGFPVLAVGAILVLIVLAPCSIALGVDSQASLIYLKFAVGLGFMMLSFVLARQKPGIEQRPWYTRWYGLLFAVIGATVAVLGFRAFFYESYLARSASMAPVAESGTLLLVQKRGYAPSTTFNLDFGQTRASQHPERGDIVAFVPPNRPGQVWIKRVVGLPGDTISYRERHLYINGLDTRGAKRANYVDPETLTEYERYEEKIGTQVFDILLRDMPTALPPPEGFPSRERCTYMDDEIRCVVPPGHYYLLGDSRDNSLDSRTLGFTRGDDIVGKVIQIGH